MQKDFTIAPASFLLNLVADGIPYSFGMLLQPLVSAFKSSAGLISFVGSINVAMMYLSAPLTSTLITKLGTRFYIFCFIIIFNALFRWVCIVGAVVSCVGIILSVFATNVVMLIFTYGVIGGFGQGLLYVPACVAAGFWFEKKRALATGELKQDNSSLIFL